MKRGKTYDWIPLWVEKWLWGSTRLELEHDERAIWIDLLVIASKDDGFIRANENIPYLDLQLAGLLCCDIDLLKRTIEKCIKYKKIEVLKNGTFRIINWDAYQLTDRHKRRLTESEQKESQFPRTVRCPEKHISMANKNGFVRTSRLLAAIAIGVPLSDENEVHHINGKEKDDRPENLILFGTHKNHLRHQHGYDSPTIWDGSAVSKAEIKSIVSTFTALTAEKTATNTKTNTKTKTKTNTKIKKGAATVKKKGKKINKNFYIEKWNSFAAERKLPEIKSITGERERHLKARISSEDFFSFDELLKTIDEQPWLLGKNEKGWRITFDWIINASNYTKIMEKNYLHLSPRREEPGRSKKPLTEAQKKHASLVEKKREELYEKYKKDFEDLRKRKDQRGTELLESMIKTEVANYSKEI